MKKLVVANWKMNPPTFREAKKLFDATKKIMERAPRVSVVVAPPSIYLRELSAKYRGRIAFALQHMHADLGGAHTGEISASQAKDAKASYVIIGHAERRGFGETNDDTRKKVVSALNAGLTPILCVGEAKRSASGDYFNVVREQLRTGLADVPLNKLTKVVVAYEPLWVISPAPSMNPEQMHEMAIFIRKTIVEMHGEGGHAARVLYGGSIDDSGNAPRMLRDGDVQGLLVGRASTDPDKFAVLIRSLNNPL